MIFAHNDDLKRVADGIRDLSLPKSDWTHAGHFAAAVWLVADPAFDAPRDMPDVIRAYNEATGVRNTDSDGYHETITQASLTATKHMLDLADKNEPLSAVHARIMASKFGRPDWLLDYWSKELLFSVTARREWVAPDRGKLVF